MAMDVEIRSGADGDLAVLVAVLGQREYFSEHLARQRDGHGSRNIAAALRCYARDATRLLPLLGITGP